MKRFFSSQLLISLALLILLILLLLPVIKNYRQRYKVDQEIAILRQQVAKAEDQNSNFKKIIDYLQSEQFVEEQARLNMGLKKPGEKVVVVQGADNQAETNQDMADQPLLDSQALRLLDNFKKWLNYFFSH